jgi:uncharacterized protein (DUF1015 family)
MADIIPFRALRYAADAPHRISPAQVVTQPYDKITPALQDRYYAASPYNLVRIILGRRETTDNPENNIYSRAAAYFNYWRRQGILRQDSLPSIYAYSQRFTSPGSSQEGSATQVERRGFIALGRLEDYSAGVVFRHEQTLAKPKADRLDLLRATRAHFGQLFMLYEDSGQVESLLTNPAEPDISVTDEYGVLHRVWQVSTPAVIASVRAAMSDKKLLIADGHHRYETALNYRNECRNNESRKNKRPAAASLSTAQPDSPHEFAMMTFVNMSNPALLILPTHRVVHSLPSFSEDAFRDSARAFFDIDEIDGALDAPRATAILRESGRAGTSILAVTPNRAFLLHHPNPNAPQLFAGLSLRQQSLDIVQLHKVLLENVLHLTEESIRNQQNISYVRDAAEALARVQSNNVQTDNVQSNEARSEPRANIVFLVNPCRMKQVRDIAFANEVMPQKSTDFYPKLLSGLTVYALD